MRTRHISSSDPVLPPLDDSRGKSRHQPVLLHEVIDALEVQKDDVVVDATLGGAGHAVELVKGLGGNGLFIGFDADADAIERAQVRLTDDVERGTWESSLSHVRAEESETVQFTGAFPKIHLVHGNFRNIVSELAALGVSSITKTLFDLGWSSHQLDSGLPGQGRGFSFKTDEPLDMRYGDSDLTAAAIVNTWSEQTLADIIFGFGGERYSRRIARTIVERRARKPFAISRELAATIQEATPLGYRRGRIHPATRTFQALRIAVNDELSALSEGLAGAWSRTAVGGRIAVISFHSLEDRIVKRTFADWAKRGEGKLLAKKPIVPTREEERENPRSRSAKLRVIEKISYESKNTKNKQIRPLDISGKT
jgi:16S rRNA (cytosine1402-N4)-methyltransferase